MSIVIIIIICLLLLIPGSFWLDDYMYSGMTAFERDIAARPALVGRGEVPILSAPARDYTALDAGAFGGGGWLS